MKLLYLSVDILTLVVPLFASFHPKINFYKTWKALFAALICVAIPFLIFDSIFTAHAIWSFNPRYLSGFYLFNLPMEEILFFICIPYSCMFTYYCMNKFYNLSWNPKAENIFCILFSMMLLITGVIFSQKLYTSSTFISTAIFCIFLKFGLNVRWIGKAFSAFAILILPFLIVNGILTGTGISAPVVSYNPTYNLGIRIMTIPIEDFIYGFELFLLNLSLYFWFNKQNHTKQPYIMPLGAAHPILNKKSAYKVAQNHK